MGASYNLVLNKLDKEMHLAGERGGRKGGRFVACTQVDSVPFIYSHISPYSTMERLYGWHVGFGIRYAGRLQLQNQ